MNLLQHIFSQAENLVFQFQKSRGRIFLCLSPTFASPIEMPATSALRRICREIIGNTEGNAKTVESLRCCKWTNSDSKSPPKTKKTTGGPVGGEFSKWWSILRLFGTFLSASKRRIFQVSNGRQFHLLEKFSARCFRIHAEPLS